MANQTLTRAQVEKLVKENPKFAEELKKAQEEDAKRRSVSSVAGEVKVFKDFTEARAKLGLITMKSESAGRIIDTKDAKMLSSGVITNNKFYPAIEKSKAAICFTPQLTENVDFGVISKEEHTYPFSFNNIELIRVNILYKNGDSLETVAHFEKDDCAILGKGNLLYKCELLTEAPKEGEPSVIKARPYGYFNIDYVNGSIKTCMDPNDVEIEGEWLFVPLFTTKSVFDTAEAVAVKAFDDSKDAILDMFVSKITDDAKRAKMRSFVESQLYGNTEVNKYAVSTDFTNSKFPELTDDLFEDNSGEVDELNTLGLLFPHYGTENIDVSSAELDPETGLPVISHKEIANLKVIGITPDVIAGMLENATTTVKQAKENIETNKKELADKELAAYNATCALSVAIGETDWFKAATTDDAAETLVLKAAYEKENKTSEKFIDATMRQLIGFKNVAARIQTKIDRGEFSNAYLLSSVVILKKVFEKYRKADETPCSILTDLLRTLNYYYLDGIDKADMIARKDKVSQNSLMNMIGIKDQFGNEDRTIASILDSYKSSLINTKDIPEGISEEEETDQLINRAQARYEFLKAIACSSIQVLTKLYPEIGAAVIGEEKPSDFATGLAAKYRSDVGFEGIDEPEYLDLVKKIVEAIKLARENATDVAAIATMSVKNATVFADKIGKKTFKGRGAKLGVYLRTVAVLDTAKYMDPIISGLLPVAADEKIDDESLIVVKAVKDGAEIKLEDYTKLSDEEKLNYTVFKKITNNDKLNLFTDVVVRTSLLSSLCTVMYKLIKDFDEFVDEKSGADAAQMFVSSLSLLVPSLQILETVNISKTENYDPMKLIDGDKKVKLGTSAIKCSLEGVETIDALKAARKAYVLECLKFVETSVNS